MKKFFKIGCGCLGVIFVIFTVFVLMIQPSDFCTDPFCDEFNMELDENPVYLDSNGVTVKAKDWAKIGYVGEIDGLRYEIVDLEGLKHYASYGKYLVTEDNKFGKDFLYKDPRKGFEGIIGINGRKHKEGDPLMFPCTSLITDMTGAFAARNNIDTEEGPVTTTNLDKIVANAIAGGSVNAIKGEITSSYTPNTFLYMFDKMSTFDVSNVTNMKNLFQERGFSKNEIRGDWIYSSVGYYLGYPDLSNWDIRNVDEETLQMSNMPAGLKEGIAPIVDNYGYTKTEIGYMFDFLPPELRPKK